MRVEAFIYRGQWRVTEYSVRGTVMGSNDRSCGGLVSTAALM